jgi:elongation factor P--beta-lysine ligase
LAGAYRQARSLNNELLGTKKRRPQVIHCAAPSPFNSLAYVARFEIYSEGIRLANGVHQLTNAEELKQRHQQELATRTNGEQLDESFHRAMQLGLPDCASVAVGFDRLVMIALGLHQIADTQAIPWDDA